MLSLSHAMAVQCLHSLTLTFYFQRFNLRFKNQQCSSEKIISVCVSIVNLCFSQILFQVIIQNPIKKSHRLFVKATRVMLTSRLTYKYKLPLHHSVGLSYLQKCSFRANVIFNFKITMMCRYGCASLFRLIPLLEKNCVKKPVSFFLLAT